jgi:hypothetical protein
MNIPTKLTQIAGNRDFITTNEFATFFSVAPQTVRKNYCLEKNCYGIVPKKFGSRLLWSVQEIADVLGY